MTTTAAPTGLPVEGSVTAIRDALATEGHAVLRAAPGAGKTTVVPLRLLDEPWLAGLRIVVLEPRRLAARAAAQRMAYLLGEPVGETVGFVTRDERRIGSKTRIEVVTEGILTRRIQHDALLDRVGLVVFDEVHERNLQTDVALALALDVRAGLRPELRLLAMSATVDVTAMAALLGGSGHDPAPVIESVGRAYPVDIRWAPPPPRQRLAEAVAATTVRSLRECEGDVLVFLPGAGDIRRVQGLLSAGPRPDDVDVRPLFGALSRAEQDLALTASAPGRRRVVLATDIAETSLTVDGVRVVVDGGQSRTPQFDTRTGLTRLRTGPISRASAEQRSGRAGRVAPGVAYRVWSKLEHAGRQRFSEPEIASVDLAGLALELAVWGAAAEDLPFLDAPPPRALDEGRNLLVALGGLDRSGRPTEIGRAMADLPLHPRLAAMIVRAERSGLGWEASVLAALLEDRDVMRGRPDDVPVDLAERARLVVDREAHHPSEDRRTVAATRRRADELARRAGVRSRSFQTGRLGRVLAIAYPDRLAQARGGDRFRLRSGQGAWVPSTDPLAGEAFLVIADLDGQRGDARVRLAVGIDEHDLVEAVIDDVETITTVAWDDASDDVRATETRRVDGLELGSTTGTATPGLATTAALLARVGKTRLEVLRWSAAARSLQDRVAFLRRTLGADWPDLCDQALLDDVDRWLVPFLNRARGRADLERVDVLAALRSRLDYHQLRQLEQFAPPRVDIAGRSFVVDYHGDDPKMSARVQDLFGVTRHPTVVDGRVRVLVELLSPARRPVQITSDLPGFWAGSYADVRKEMAGRYPKHRWPTDPTSSQ